MQLYKYHLLNQRDKTPDYLTIQMWLYSSLVCQFCPKARWPLICWPGTLFKSMNDIIFSKNILTNNIKKHGNFRKIQHLNRTWKEPTTITPYCTPTLCWSKSVLYSLCLLYRERMRSWMEICALINLIISMTHESSLYLCSFFYIYFFSISWWSPRSFWPMFMGRCLVHHDAV